MDSFKYEVAFSYLQGDERLAHEIKDLIADRVSTFIYSEQQKELAGTDGELTFNTVFGTEARIVVVFYRDGWGKSPWTRIEEIAIKNRAYNEGWEFVLFVLLDKKSTIPKYLPKTQIWLDFERWGANGLAPIIEQRIAIAGGTIREETIADQVEHLSRQRNAEKERNQYLRSENVLSDAQGEFYKLQTGIQQGAKIMEDSKTGIHFSTESQPGYYYKIGYNGLALKIHKGIAYENLNCPKTRLTVSICSYSGRPNRDYQENDMYSQEYYFDRSLTGIMGWSIDDKGKDFVTSDRLIELWIKRYISELRSKSEWN